jgi:hypothetical protein
MQRDIPSNELLNDMVAKALADGRVYPMSHIMLAYAAYPKIQSKRRRELTVSRLAQQIGAKLRRKLPKPPKHPTIPGLLDEENRA